MDLDKYTAKSVTSNRSPRGHCIENQKRERKPSSYCLQTCRSMVNYSRIIGEAPMRTMNPSMMVSRLDLWFLELAAAGIVFRRLLQGFCNIWEFIGRRGGAGGHRGGHKPSGHALVGASPLEAPPRCFLGPLDVLWPKKILKKFRCIWTPFGIDFLRCKKHAEKINWHLALCQ